jgi:hypothetical protein
LGAQWTGITTVVGASVPMLASWVKGPESNPIHRDASPNFQDQTGLSSAHPPVVFGEESRFFRFPDPIPADLMETIRSQTDLQTLSRWFDAAPGAASLEEFRAAVGRRDGQPE